MDGFQALTRGLRNTKEAAAGLSGLTITDLLLVTAWVWGSLVDPGPPLSQAAFQKLIQIWVAKNSLGPPARPNGAGKRSAGDEWANQSPRGLLPCDQRKETAEGAWKIKKLCHWSKKRPLFPLSLLKRSWLIATHQGACRIQPSGRGLWFYSSGVNTSTLSWRSGLNWAHASELGCLHPTSRLSHLGSIHSAEGPTLRSQSYRR